MGFGNPAGDRQAEAGPLAAARGVELHEPIKDPPLIAGWDPVTFVAGPLAFALVALLASYLPARRAMRVDPVIALRAD